MNDRSLPGRRKPTAEGEQNLAYSPQVTSRSFLFSSGSVLQADPVVGGSKKDLHLPPRPTL
jgi:hypothetical protein